MLGNPVFWYIAGPVAGALTGAAIEDLLGWTGWAIVSGLAVCAWCVGTGLERRMFQNLGEM